MGPNARGEGTCRILESHNSFNPFSLSESDSRPPRAVFDHPDYKHGVLPAEVLIAVQPPLLCNFESSLIAVCVIISVIFNEVILEMRWLLPGCVRVMILSCL